MSNTITLTASKRDLLGKGNARRFRRAGQIPVNVYSKGEESKSLVISEAEAKLAQHHNGLITLNIEGAAPQSAVMKEIQIHPISNKILHIDFHAVKADEMIKSVVPLVLEGEAAGLRQGGELEQVLHEVEIVKAISDPELIVAHCRAHKVTAEEAAEDAAAAEAAEEKEEAAAGDAKKK